MTGIFIFLEEGTIVQEAWGTEAPVESLGDEEAEAVCRHCLQILTAETIKI